MRKYISIDRDVIASNAANGRNDPPIVVENDEGDAMHGYWAQWDGESRLVYKPNNPEGRINSAWVETDVPVMLQVSPYRPWGRGVTQADTVTLP